MTKLSKHLKAALFTLALTVGVFSIGSLVKGETGPFAGCTNATFIQPAANTTYSTRVGDNLAIKVQPGSCDYQLKNVYAIFTGQDENGFIGGIYLNKDLSDGIFTVPWKMTDVYSSAGHLNQPKIKATLRQRSPIDPNAVREIETPEIYFHLTVRQAQTTQSNTGQAITTLPICPPTQLTSPSATTVSGTATVSVARNSAHSRRVFDITSGTTTPLHHEGTALSTTWNTAVVPNGTYTISSSAECVSGYQATSSPQSITVNVSNPNPPPANTQSQTSSSVVTYTTPTGEKVQVKPALLALSKYRQTIAAPKSELLEIKEAAPVAGSTGKNEKVRFKGLAKPGAKYKLVVFSEPKELDFTTDKDGNWQVELNETLDPGEHEAYVVLNDSKGKPVERSNVLSFVVPTAEAANANQPQTVRESAQSRARYYAAYSGLVILAAMLGFFGLQAARSRRHKDSEPIPETSTEE